MGYSSGLLYGVLVGVLQWGTPMGYSSGVLDGVPHRLPRWSTPLLQWEWGSHLAEYLIWYSNEVPRWGATVEGLYIIDDKSENCVREALSSDCS